MRAGPAPHCGSTEVASPKHSFHTHRGPQPSQDKRWAVTRSNIGGFTAVVLGESLDTAVGPMATRAFERGWADRQVPGCKRDEKTLLPVEKDIPNSLGI